MIVQAGIAAGAGLALIYTARTYRLSRQGQDNERYIRALDHLGSDELYVRIGSIHALEHVMRDSENHQNDVVELLAAFIRSRLPLRAAPVPGEIWTRWSTDEGSNKITHSRRGWLYLGHSSTPRDDYVVWPPRRPAPDVQAALTALARRPARIEWELERVNLSDLAIQNIHLPAAFLPLADLRGTDLRGTYLDKAYLVDANLSDANLNNVWLVGANLNGANLIGADLRDVKLAGVNLRGAHLFRADLRGALLDCKTMLYPTDLPGADLTGADLLEANLCGVDLTEVQGLTEIQLRYSKVNSETRFPPHLRWDDLGERVISVDR
ncbi:pentapeptide repeat-containing protein [Kitasatospora sp. NPDC058444]|uniref:pentapeptide repeat-containing protein n=1 Tax=Kitasatospora sp. NPDC058444 TaxID=3346504 RepID=UPI00365F097F